MSVDYMAEAKRVFADYDGQPSCDYGAAVRRCGEVILQKDLGDYQGDLLFIIKEGQRYGYLCLGYGSCSSCDWFQGIETWEAAAEALKTVEGMIQWYTLAELKKWVAERDWEGSHLWYHGDELREFIEAVGALK